MKTKQNAKWSDIVERVAAQATERGEKLYVSFAGGCVFVTETGVTRTSRGTVMLDWEGGHILVAYIDSVSRALSTTKLYHRHNYAPDEVA